MLVNRLPLPCAALHAILFLRLMIIGASISGLAWLRAARPAQRPARGAAAPEPPSVVGEVAVVDEEKRFVLIDLDSNLYVPAPGTACARPTQRARSRT